MHASTSLLPFQRRLRLFGAAGACALLAGCIGNPFVDAKVDPSSPIAAEVAQAGRAKTGYPSFAAIPPRPTDIRPARGYAREAAAIEQARADLEAMTAPETWSLSETDEFAKKARAEAGSEPAPQSTGETAAFAETQRKRATPPPPPER